MRWLNDLKYEEKIYTTALKDRFRFLIFNLILVLSLYSKVSAQRGMGLDMSSQSTFGIPRMAVSRGFGNALVKQASVKQYAPYAADQGQTGTCVAYASAYAARTILWAKKNQMSDRAAITKAAFSPSYLYRSINDDPYCKSGNLLAPAAEHMKNVGCAPESTVGSVCLTSVANYMHQAASAYKVSAYHLLFDPLESNNEKKIISIKKTIANGNPVVIGMRVTSDFDYLSAAYYKPSIPLFESKNGHAMTIVSYDDDKYGGAFEIMNSWGREWGDDGFCWMSYTDVANRTIFALELVDNMVEPRVEPQNLVYSDYDFSAELTLVELKSGITPIRIQALENGRLTPTRGMGNQTLIPGNKPYTPNNQVSFGQFLAYKSQRAYTHPDKFHVMLKSEQPVFAYMINMDSRQKAAVLFPSADGNGNVLSAAINGKGDEVILQSVAGQAITLDQNTGVEYLCVLLSKEELDIEAISMQLESTSGTFFQRLNQVLGSKLVDKNLMRYYNEKMKVEMKSGGRGTVVPIVLEMDHI